MQSFDTAKTVLVVDDYEPICQLIELLLVQVGFVVHTSTTGLGAIRIAQILPEIHLTICGLDLADMCAEECVDECGKCHPDAAILFVSDSIRPIITPRPFTILEKPFTLKELRTAVHGSVGTALSNPRNPVPSSQRPSPHG